MASGLSILWNAPRVNAVNGKACTIPALNPFNVYGRVFFLSWFGFLIAFWSWYAFPPLLTVTIKKDLNLSQADVANSNILSLTSTLIVRLIAGPACDRFGPRLTFVALLLAGAVPTALAGAVTNANGLLALRFFVGILGGTFIPCEVWTTAFFDKEIVGTANALTAGFGNAGGGITYFVMPAIFDSLVRRQNLTAHVAWRVTFIVPFILITSTALLMLLVAPDTPSGKWSERSRPVERSLQARGEVVHEPGSIRLNPEAEKAEGVTIGEGHGKVETPPGDLESVGIAKDEVVQSPTGKEYLRVALSPPTVALSVAYFCSFGAELAINSILGAYYLTNFKTLGQTGSGNWAAMFGLLNVFFRPAGGIISDIIFRRTRSLWGKKMWIHGVAVAAGVFLIAIGLVDSHKQSTMFGLVAGMAFFMEAGNGANFSLVPHVHPHANGIVSGICGAAGNLGGIVFAIIFRYNGTQYARVMWITGAMTIALNLAVAWIRPVPRGQIGGR
ncbi:MAG: hypothetical protein M1832_002374 [Thelocarpon impressellum]|nr:MAG: hypothetical protein M1832_002374 [Thelocarpon impressellum]